MTLQVIPVNRRKRTFTLFGRPTRFPDQRSRSGLAQL